MLRGGGTSLAALSFVACKALALGPTSGGCDPHAFAQSCPQAQRSERDLRFIMDGLRRLMGGYARVSSVADEGNGSGKAVALTSQQAAPSSSQQQQRSVAMVRAAAGCRCVHAWAAARCCMQPRKLVLLLTLAMRLPHALRVQVSVKGMTCAACSGAVERALRCAREG